MKTTKKLLAIAFVFIHIHQITASNVVGSDFSMSLQDSWQGLLAFFQPIPLEQQTPKPLPLYAKSNGKQQLDCSEYVSSLSEVDTSYFLDFSIWDEPDQNHPICEGLKDSPAANKDLKRFFRYFLEVDARCLPPEEGKKVQNLLDSGLTLLEFAASNLVSQRYHAGVGEKISDSDYVHYDGSPVLAYVSYDPEIIRSRFSSWLYGSHQDDFPQITCTSNKATLSSELIKYDPLSLISGTHIDLQLTWDLVQSHPEIKDLQLTYPLSTYENPKDLQHQSYLTKAKQNYRYFKNQATKRALNGHRRSLFTGRFRCAIHILENIYPTPVGGWTNEEVKDICYSTMMTDAGCTPERYGCVDRILKKGNL
jgi:hypothetical protein